MDIFSLINIVDVIIILGILMFGVIGLKRGVIKQVVMTIGTLCAYFLAFKLKGGLADVLMHYLPFFNFPGNFEGISVLNILLYQAISFIILVSLFLIILGIIIKISSLIETVLKFTIILGIPSKILGFIVGLIEGFIVTYMVLFFIKQPLFNSEQINKSKFMTPILTSTPVLSNIASNMNDTFKDIYLLKDKFKNEDKNTFNLEALDVMLKYDIVKPSSVDLLVKNDKLKDVKNIDSILSKYRK